MTSYQDLFKTSDIISTFEEIGWDDFKKFTIDIKLDEVYKLCDVGRRTKRQREVIEEQLQIPEVKKITEDRYLGEEPHLARLSQMAPDSIGYKYAYWYQKLGFNVDFYQKIPIQDDLTYIEYRLRQTHDIWHLATGFDTSFAGEMGLQAFMYAQLQYPVSAVFLSAALLRCVDHPEEVSDIFNLIAKGWEIGLQSKSLLAQRWEDFWDKNLFTIREELSLPTFGVNLVI